MDVENIEKTTMQLPNARVIGIMGLLAIMEAAPKIGVAAPRDRDHAAGQEAANGNGGPALPVSQMQVSGTTNNFTVSAQHADVLSLLKLVFDQAHRQFVPDASVTGDVTFALSGQRFDGVLAAICKQAFLRYDVDKNGVYQFRRDDEALRSLILKTRAINVVLQEQLRRMGYAVPSAVAANSFAAGGFGGGMSGGRAFGRSLSSSGVTQDSYELGRGEAGGAPAGVSRDQNAAAGLSKTQKDTALSLQASKRSNPRVRGAAEPQGPQSSTGPQGAQGPQGNTRQFGDNSAQQPAKPDMQQGLLETQDSVGNAAGGQGVSSSLNLDDGAQYQWFLRQNHLVTLNTKDARVPLRDVLADLGKQAGVAVLIDPAVPRGVEFVINASIPPHPLKEVLNLLASQAHLEWRWLNNRVFITTTPQLLLYLRGTQLPTVGGTTVPPQRSAAPQNAAPPTDKKADDKSEQANKDKSKGN